jgi:glycosyltransferase involved in cell wall biosynthesis
MKLALVWENGMAKWVSQMFEPLAALPSVEITAFVGERNKFDVSQVTLDKRFLSHKEEFHLGLGELPQSLARIWHSPYKRLDFYHNSLSKYLRGFDLVECTDSSRSLYTAADLKRKLGYKLVVSYLENIPYRQVFDEKTNYIKHKTFDAIDHFIPWCKTIEQAMLVEGVPKEKMTTVYSSLDINQFRPKGKDAGLLRQYGIDEGTFTILYIGKLVSWKGVHNLAYAAKVLLNEGYRNFKFIIAGRGAQLSNLEKIIKEARLENYFCYAGFLPYERIVDLHNLADVFVLPSYPAMTWQEQFGMVLVEAMACGKPVVSTLTGSIPEVVGDAGLLVAAGDYYELAHQIARLMDDRVLREGLGVKARQRAVDQFDANKNGLKLYAVYKQLLETSCQGTK